MDIANFSFVSIVYSCNKNPFWCTMATDKNKPNPKKRSFSEWEGGDYYLCADCDSVYHGQQALCEHLAKHTNIKRQVIIIIINHPCTYFWFFFFYFCHCQYLFVNMINKRRGKEFVFEIQIMSKHWIIKKLHKD